MLFSLDASQIEPGRAHVSVRLALKDFTSSPSPAATPKPHSTHPTQPPTTNDTSVEPSTMPSMTSQGVVAGQVTLSSQTTDHVDTSIPAIDLSTIPSITSQDVVAGQEVSASEPLITIS